MNVNPVMLPPGRARLATKPRPTGSFTRAQTIGMVLVNFCSAAITGVLLARITSGFSADQLLGVLLNPADLARRPSDIRS